MRGEKRTLRALRKENKGSPPLARGKGNDTILYIGIDRITPACAGKSKGISKFLSGHKDHPRLRGEKVFLIFGALWLPGSPPLARGKGGFVNSAAGVIGITPACAGKSYEIDNDEIVVEDHPRLRGEKTLYLI